MMHKIVQPRVVSLMAAALLLGVLVLAGARAVGAAPSAFDLSWWTVDGGGGSLAGGSYSLSATIGQPDAGALTGGAYTLSGGFWSALPSAPPPAGWKLMLPVVVR